MVNDKISLAFSKCIAAETMFELLKNKAIKAFESKVSCVTAYEQPRKERNELFDPPRIVGIGINLAFVKCSCEPCLFLKRI